MKMIRQAPFLLLFLTLLLPVLAQDVNTSGELPDSAAADVPDAVIEDPRPTIPSYLQSTGQHEVLLLAISLQANLTETLAVPGTRFTVFAPTDSAFANLARALSADGADFDQNDPEAVAAALQAGLDRLRQLQSSDFIDLRSLLAYHIIGEALSYQQLEKKGRAMTNQGERLRFADGVIIDGDSRFNVTAGPKNVFATNGWINVINEVLLPFNLERALRDAENAEKPVPNPAPVEGSPEPVEGGPTPEPGASPVSVPVDTETGEEVPTETDGEEIVGGGTAEGEEEDPMMSPTSSPEDDGPACFPGSARVMLADGSKVRMDELSSSHEIRFDTGVETSRVFLFTHRSAAKIAWFYKVTTANGHSVKLTGGHYVHANSGLIAAESVRIGDVVRTIVGESQVTDVRREKDVGVFAPHTLHGDLVVDGVIVSGYSTAVHPRLAHALLAPVRLVADVGGVGEPLGSLLYEGADRVVGWLPMGKKRV